MLYVTDAMIPLEVNSPTWRRINFDDNLNKEGLDNSADLIEEIIRMTHVRKCAAKHRMARRFNTRVRLRIFQKGDFVLKKITSTEKKGKFSLNWEGPYRIRQKLNNVAYKLENLEGVEMPRAWNLSNLRFYYS